MMTVAIAGDDTINLNGRKFSDLPDNDIATLTYSDNAFTVSRGKDGNVIVAPNSQGLKGDFVLRVLKGSADDIYLNSYFETSSRATSGLIMMNGFLIKRIGNGAGKYNTVTYTLLNGVITKGADAVSNVGGETEQAVSTWNFTFGNVIQAQI